MSVSTESLSGPATANLANSFVDEFEWLQDEGRMANTALSCGLHEVFSPAGIWGAGDGSPAGRYEAFSEEFTYSEPGEPGQGGANTYKSFQVSDGETALLTYGLGSSVNILVQRVAEMDETAEAGDRYTLLYIFGRQTGTGVRAEHTFVKYDVRTQADLVGELGIERALALYRAAESVETTEGGGEDIRLGQPVQVGMLNSETLGDMECVYPNPGQVRQWIETGIGLSAEAQQMIKSIGVQEAEEPTRLVRLWRRTLGHMATLLTETASQPGQ